ncbi:carcinoembryonic antigen-related cell adhesion molecule 5-like, partial [Clarias magur]
RPNLTSSHEGAVLSGTSVTLNCTLNLQSDGWTFYWTTPSQSTETKTEGYYSTSSFYDYYYYYYHYYYHYYSHYNISSVNVSDGGQYRCRAGRGHPVYYTQYSNALWVNVIESPKYVVIIKPDTEVFRGERVTFRCDIQTGGTTEWTYEWYRDGYTFYPYSTAQEFTDRYYYSSGKYTCRGRRRSDSQLSQISDPVTLSVSDNPKPQLTSSHKGDALTGNSVTLNCTLNLSPAGWTFYWTTPTSTPTSTATQSHTESHRATQSHTISATQSTESVTAGYNSSYYYHYYSHYNISSVNVSDGGQYRCRAGRGDPVYYTLYSDDLSLSVIESPKPVVIIKPDTQVFRGERVTFRCNIEGGGTTEWTYEWYRDGATVYPDSTAQEFTVTDYYYGGKYTCRGRRSDYQLSQTSDAVTLSVSEKPKPDLTSSHKGNVLSGNSVTLTCTLNLQPAGWKFYWFKDGQHPEIETETNSYNIRSVGESNRGGYQCRAGRGKDPVYYTHYSDKLWLDVTENTKPELISDLKGDVLTGNSVTLTCTLKLQSAGWRFYWITPTQSTETEIAGYYSSSSFSYIIRSVSVSDGGQYRCRAGIGNPVYYTLYSNDLPLKVTESPKPVASIRPYTQVIRGESITLRCYIQDQRDTEWTYSWYRDGVTVYSSRKTQEFTEYYYYSSGTYTCRGRRSDSQLSQISNGVILSAS